MGKAREKIVPTIYEIQEQAKLIHVDDVGLRATSGDIQILYT